MGRTSKKRQTEIPGTERPSHPEIEEAFEAYQEGIAAKAAAAAVVKEGRDKVIRLMKEQGLESYAFIDGEKERTIHLDRKEKLRVSNRGLDDPANENAGGDGESDGNDD